MRSDFMAANIRSFVKETQPKSYSQFVAVVAYYHRFMAPEGDRKETITTSDFLAAAKQAQWAVVKPSSDIMNSAVEQGYMDRAAHDEYRLNVGGENLVSMALPGKTRDPAVWGVLIAQDDEPPEATPPATTTPPSEKLRYDLIPWDAVEQVVRVIMFGAAKYRERGWEIDGIADDDSFASAQRHLLEWYEQGANSDAESGLHPLAHAACRVLFALALDLRRERRGRESQ